MYNGMGRYVCSWSNDMNRFMLQDPGAQVMGSGLSAVVLCAPLVSSTGVCVLSENSHSTGVTEQARTPGQARFQLPGHPL